jgi:CubicO group peptidase (beta-lactamase class C family)
MGLPVQVKAPGTFTVYCNDCAVLAAYIVEQVSGLPFATYVAEIIFEPLGMQHSTYHQVLPPQLSR